MCGIAGIAFAAGSASADNAIRRMLPPLSRRGPDAEGLHLWHSASGTTVGFGHRRLAILDLSPAGAQPMLSADGQVGVVFNGCIYNFIEIRHELEQRGHTFRSRCDTEVLIEGYREWGIDGMLPRLRGMFAFALWDEPRRMLALVRDRLGVKPLVYSIAGDRIAFASTLDSLQAGGFTGDLDSGSALEFLDQGFVPEECSIFAGARKLPPASVLVWQAGRAGEPEVTEHTYWTLPEADEASPVRFEEAVEETERLLIEAVRRRLVSDVPIGALLSGGIDSTLVCWALSRLKANVRAFTVGTPGDPEDESAQAKETAARLDIPHEVVYLKSDEPPPFDELTAAYSEPFASTSALGMLSVSRAVKPKATVLLTGDGGDEIFLGYPFFHNAWKAQRLARRLPSFSPGLWKMARPVALQIPALKRPSNFIDYTVGGVGAYGRVRLGLPYFEQRGLLGPAMLGRTVAYRQTPASFESGRRLLHDVVRFQKRTYFTGEFLTKVDGATMFHSLEARAPLLDPAIWEYAAALPPEIHFHGGQLKAVLREIVRRYAGPDIAFRRKQGFTIPVERWLVSKWSSQLKEWKQSPLVVEKGWLKAQPLSAAIDEALARGEMPKQLFHAFVLEKWLARKREAPLHSPERLIPGNVVTERA